MKKRTFVTLFISCILLCGIGIPSLPFTPYAQASTVTKKSSKKKKTASVSLGNKTYSGYEVFGNAGNEVEFFFQPGFVCHITKDNYGDSEVYQGTYKVSGNKVIINFSDNNLQQVVWKLNIKNGGKELDFGSNGDFGYHGVQLELVK